MAFASLWLAFAAVPCSAMETFGIDLGHQHAAAMPSAASDHACPHCPNTAPAKGATPGDCSGLDDAVLSKVSAVDLVLAAAPLAPTLASVQDADRRHAAIARVPAAPPPIPLNVRYCTFLE